eukprot:273415-Chlamydomonas_euryale.AAC.1
MRRSSSATPGVSPCAASATAAARSAASSCQADSSDPSHRPPPPPPSPPSPPSPPPACCSAAEAMPVGQSDGLRAGWDEYRRAAGGVCTTAGRCRQAVKHVAAAECAVVCRKRRPRRPVAKLIRRLDVGGARRGVGGACRGVRRAWGGVKGAWGGVGGAWGGVGGAWGGVGMCEACWRGREMSDAAGGWWLAAWVA